MKQIAIEGYLLNNHARWMCCGLRRRSICLWKLCNGSDNGSNQKESHKAADGLFAAARQRGRRRWAWGVGRRDAQRARRRKHARARVRVCVGRLWCRYKIWDRQTCDARLKRKK